MISRLLIRFLCRGDRRELSPAFQRLEWPSRSASRGATIEWRLSRTKRASVSSHREIIRRRFCWSTVAPRLFETIARFPALKRRARLNSRSAAGRPSFFTLSRSAAGRPSFFTLSRSAAGRPSFFTLLAIFALLAFFVSSLHPFSDSSHGAPHEQPVSFVDITQSAKIAFNHEN